MYIPAGSNRQQQEWYQNPGCNSIKHKIYLLQISILSGGTSHQQYYNQIYWQRETKKLETFKAALAVIFVNFVFLLKYINFELFLLNCTISFDIHK